MEFGIPGYNDLVWDVFLVCDRIGRPCTQHGLNGKLQLGDYLNARARSKIGEFRRDYVAKNITFAPVILPVAGKIHPEFLRLLWLLANMQTVKYFNLALISFAHTFLTGAPICASLNNKSTDHQKLSPPHLQPSHEFSRAF